MQEQTKTIRTRNKSFSSSMQTMGNIKKNKHPWCKQRYSVMDSQHYFSPLQSPPQCVQPANRISSPAVAESDKDRNAFALLGFLIGCIGIHQFYIGNIGKGITTILAYCICSPVGLFIVGIDILRTTTDSKQCPLKDKDSPVATGLGWLMILGGIVLFVISLLSPNEVKTFFVTNNSYRDCSLI